MTRKESAEVRDARRDPSKPEREKVLKSAAKKPVEVVLHLDEPRAREYYQQRFASEKPRKGCHTLTFEFWFPKERKLGKYPHRKAAEMAIKAWRRNSSEFAKFYTPEIVE